MPSTSLPPLYSMGSTDLSFPQNLRVGKPWMSRPATSFSVESILASTMLGLLDSCLAASSKRGARVLQCPHQGAQNLTKTSFSWLMAISAQLLPTITFTGSSLVSGMGADFRKGSSSPELIWAAKAARASALTSSASYLYLAALLLRKRTLGVTVRSTPRYSPNRSQSPWPSFLEETQRTNPGLVSSNCLKASRDAASDSSSPMKMKRASLLSLNTFSMASLLKGMTSARATVRRSATRRVPFMLQLKQIMICSRGSSDLDQFNYEYHANRHSSTDQSQKQWPLRERSKR